MRGKQVLQRQRRIYSRTETGTVGPRLGPSPPDSGMRLANSVIVAAGVRGVQTPR